jgi:hypothetical protein
MLFRPEEGIYSFSASQHIMHGTLSRICYLIPSQLCMRVQMMLLKIL